MPRITSTPVSISYTGEINSTDITITIDNQPVNFIISDNTIVITDTQLPGFHLLKLTTLTDTKVDIVKVLVDNCDLRKLLYLSWLEPVVGKRIQPATGWWEAGQTWILPYGNPVSNWINQVERKILNGLYGKNLFDSYWFYYPTGTVLTNHKFPQIMHDFFQYNFDFTIIPKTNYTLAQIPYMRYTKDIPDTLIDQVMTEIHQSSDYIQEHKTIYTQHKLNNEEFGVCAEKDWTLFNGVIFIAKLLDRVIL